MGLVSPVALQVTLPTLPWSIRGINTSGREALKVFYKRWTAMNILSEELQLKRKGGN